MGGFFKMNSRQKGILCDILPSLGGCGENFVFSGGNFCPGPRQNKASPPRDLGKIGIYC